MGCLTSKMSQHIVFPATNSSKLHLELMSCCSNCTKGFVIKKTTMKIVELETINQ